MYGQAAYKLAIVYKKNMSTYIFMENKLQMAVAVCVNGEFFKKYKISGWQSGFTKQENGSQKSNKNKPTKKHDFPCNMKDYFIDLQQSKICLWHHD